MAKQLSNRVRLGAQRRPAYRCARRWRHSPSQICESSAPEHTLPPETVSSSKPVSLEAFGPLSASLKRLSPFFIISNCHA